MNTRALMGRESCIGTGTQRAHKATLMSSPALMPPPPVCNARPRTHRRMVCQSKDKEKDFTVQDDLLDFVLAGPKVCVCVSVCVLVQLYAAS